MTTTPETQAAISELAMRFPSASFAPDIRLVLAHVAALEAEIDRLLKSRTSIADAGNENCIAALEFKHRAESAERERDEARAVNQSQLSLIKKQEDQHFSTLEHNRMLREALAEYLALSSTDGRSERQQLRAKLKELIALTPADVESELTRLRKALAASCSDERSLAISEGPMHGICPLAEGYRAEAFQLGAAVELAMAAEVNYVKERDQLRSHISALIAAGDSQHARLVEYFKYLGEEIARLSLNESASTGVQRLSLECAKELAAWFTAKSGVSAPRNITDLTPEEAEKAVDAFCLRKPDIVRALIIDLAKRWPGHDGVNYETTSTENLVRLIADACEEITTENQPGDDAIVS